METDEDYEHVQPNIWRLSCYSVRRIPVCQAYVRHLLSPRSRQGETGTRKR